MDNTVIPEKPADKAIVPEIVNTYDMQRQVMKDGITADIAKQADNVTNDNPGKDNIKTVVKIKPLSLSRSLFCDYVVRHGLSPIDAYCKAYPKCKRTASYHGVERLLKNVQVKAELDRLRNAINPNKQESIDALHNKAVETLESIMVNSDKDSVRLGAVNAIINRTVPVVNKSLHVGVKINREEIDRRYNALQE